MHRRFNKVRCPSIWVMSVLIAIHYSYLSMDLFLISLWNRYHDSKQYQVEGFALQRWTQVLVLAFAPISHQPISQTSRERSTLTSPWNRMFDICWHSDREKNRSMLHSQQLSNDQGRSQKSKTIKTQSGRKGNNSGKKNMNKRPTKPRSTMLRPTAGNRNGASIQTLPSSWILRDNDTHPTINEERLWSDSLSCSHFNECSGCVVNQGGVAHINTVMSAKLFFQSAAVRKKRLDLLSKVKQGANQQERGMRVRRQPSNDGDDDGNNDDGDDYFFQLVVPSPVRGWRTQAKLAVAPQSTSVWDKDGCTLGLYRQGTHFVTSIPDCVVHHPAINIAVRAIEEATTLSGTAACGIAQAQAAVAVAASSGNRKGRSPQRPNGKYGMDEPGLRYVQLQVERTTGKICCTLVWYAAQIKQAQPSLSRLVKVMQQLQPDLFHSIWCHCHDGIGNNIFSRNPRRWHRLVGPEFLREPLPVTVSSDEDVNMPVGWLYYTPDAFRQGNMQGFEVLAMEVARAVPPGSKVCELYAGVGVLGLTALAYHAIQRHDSRSKSETNPLLWLRCSDENPANPRCFYRALDSLPHFVTGRNSIHRSSEWRRGNHVRSKHDNKSEDVEEEGMTIAQLSTLLSSGQSIPNVDSTAPLVGEKAKYIVARAMDALTAGQVLGAQVLIVDPPRKGLEPEILQELCKPYNPNQPNVDNLAVMTLPDDQVCWTNDVQTLIYVSCGFDALASDCEQLLSGRGGWLLKSATGYILFPGSDHLETVCVFERE